MNHLYKWLIALLSALGLGIALGGFIMFRLSQPAVKGPVLSSEIILQALKPQGFLVTQSIISNQEVTIDRNSGNVFKDFFLGQTITARGTMEANLGIDLSELDTHDISVGPERVTVRIPDVRLFNTRLIGEIEVENNQGIIKRILKPDDGYNESLSALTTATESLAKDAEVLAAARERSKEELHRLVTLILSDEREVVIEFTN